jgi:hypothetical protein
VKDHPLSAVRNGLFNIFAAILYTEATGVEEVAGMISVNPEISERSLICENSGEEQESCNSKHRDRQMQPAHNVLF